MCRAVRFFCPTVWTEGWVLLLSCPLPPSCARTVFFFQEEAGGIQRDWFQASLAFTAVFSSLSSVTEEDKHFPWCEPNPLIDPLLNLLDLANGTSYSSLTARSPYYLFIDYFLFHIKIIWTRYFCKFCMHTSLALQRVSYCMHPVLRSGNESCFYNSLWRSFSGGLNAWLTGRGAMTSPRCYTWDSEGQRRFLLGIDSPLMSYLKWMTKSAPAQCRIHINTFEEIKHIYSAVTDGRSCSIDRNVKHGAGRCSMPHIFTSDSCASDSIRGKTLTYLFSGSGAEEVRAPASAINVLQGDQHSRDTQALWESWACQECTPPHKNTNTHTHRQSWVIDIYFRSGAACVHITG